MSSDTSFVIGGPKGPILIDPKKNYSDALLVQRLKEKKRRRKRFW